MRNARSKLLASVLLLTLIAACNQNAEETQLRNPPPPTRTPEVKKAVPEKAVEEEKPVQVSQKTRDTYRWYCTQCHGVEGKGDGMNAQHLAVPPRNHTKSDYLSTRSDEQLFSAIKLGGLAVGRAPCMPAWGSTFDDETIMGLVNYIRELCQCEGA